MKETAKITKIDERIEDFELINANLLDIINYNKSVIAELLGIKQSLEEPHQTIGFRYGKHKRDDFK